MPHYVGATMAPSFAPPFAPSFAPSFAPPSRLHEQWNREIPAGNLRCFVGLVDCLSRAREDWKTAQESCKQDRDQDSLHFKTSKLLLSRPTPAKDKLLRNPRRRLPLPLAGIKVLAQPVADEIKC